MIMEIFSLYIVFTYLLFNVVFRIFEVQKKNLAAHFIKQYKHTVKFHLALKGHYCEGETRTQTIQSNRRTKNQRILIYCDLLLIFVDYTLDAILNVFAYRTYACPCVLMFFNIVMVRINSGNNLKLHHRKIMIIGFGFHAA